MIVDTLRLLLQEYSQATESGRADIQKEIWDKFGDERSVLVWDMSGFSLLSRRHGIVHYLSMVRRMQETTRPIVIAHKGSVVKYEADNGFAVFPSAESGIRAALEMNKVLDLENEDQPDQFHIRISCGLDHGRILFCQGADEGHDFYGDPVNTACKLGEDLANPGEILVTEPAFNLLPKEAGLTGAKITLSIAGQEIDAVSVAKPKSKSK